MKTLTLCLSLMLPAAACLAETEPPPVQEPKLHDHYLALQQMQQALLQRSPEDQARLQPQMQRAEHQACAQLRREQENRISLEDYRRQGGDQFLAFVMQFDRYCQTLR